MNQTINFIKQIVDASTDAVVIIDEQCCILATNQTFRDIFGYSEQEIINENISIIIPEYNYAENDSYIRRFIETSGKNVEDGLGRALNAVTKDNDLLEIFLTMSEIKTDAFRYFCGFIKYIDGLALDESMLELSTSPALTSNAAMRARRNNKRNQSNDNNAAAVTTRNLASSPPLGVAVAQLMEDMQLAAQADARIALDALCSDNDDDSTQREDFATSASDDDDDDDDDHVERFREILARSQERHTDAVLRTSSSEHETVAEASIRAAPLKTSPERRLLSPSRGRSKPRDITSNRMRLDFSRLHNDVCRGLDMRLSSGSLPTEGIANNLTAGSKSGSPHTPDQTAATSTTSEQDSPRLASSFVRSQIAMSLSSKSLRLSGTYDALSLPSSQQCSPRQSLCRSDGAQLFASPTKANSKLMTNSPTQSSPPTTSNSPKLGLVKRNSRYAKRKLAFATRSQTSPSISRNFNKTPINDNSLADAEVAAALQPASNDPRHMSELISGSESMVSMDARRSTDDAPYETPLTFGRRDSVEIGEVIMSPSPSPGTMLSKATSSSSVSRSTHASTSDRTAAARERRARRQTAPPNQLSHDAAMAAAAADLDPRHRSTNGTAHTFSTSRSHTMSRSISPPRHHGHGSLRRSQYRNKDTTVLEQQRRASAAYLAQRRLSGEESAQGVSLPTHQSFASTMSMSPSEALSFNDISESSKDDTVAEDGGYFTFISHEDREAAGELESLESRRKASSSCSSDEIFQSYREIDFNELNLDFEPIGKGAFGVVFKGTWRGARIACKKFMMYFDDVQRQKFRLEAACLQSVNNHPHVVKFLGAVSRGGHHCIVTEYCCHGSAFDVLIKDKIDLDEKTILTIAKDAASAVLHLHSENLVHRDIAARNVLLSENYVAKLTDFGLSRQLEDECSYNQTFNSLGPVRHMSPESIAKKRYSYHSDSYSFGVLIFELTHRVTPFGGIEPFEIAQGVVEGRLRPVIDVSKCGTTLGRLMQQCWRATANERPTMQNIYETLSILVDELKGKESTS
mmetsp:Transcript_16828/g.29083  ORF Transcript_16828/g.29083 Transcript_16828/m.29083 type:complete len:1029 (+) Transcript_16828:118-3204(+)